MNHRLRLEMARAGHQIVDFARSGAGVGAISVDVSEASISGAVNGGVNDDIDARVVSRASASGDLLLYPNMNHRLRLEMARAGHQIVDFARSGVSGQQTHSSEPDSHSPQTSQNQQSDAQPSPSPASTDDRRRSGFSLRLVDVGGDLLGRFLVLGFCIVHIPYLDILYS
jgi:hypothetical protein